MSKNDLEADFRQSLRDFKEPKSSFSMSNLWSTVDQARKDSLQAVSGSASSLYSTVQSVPKVVTGAADPVEKETCGLSLLQRYVMFGMFIFGGAMSFLLAFMTLPMIILFPGKFALSYSMGSLLIITSFAFLRGPMTHFKSLLTQERLPFTVMYLVSIVATLYAALIAKSYILILLFTIIQIVALAWYISSYFPGGVSTMSWMTQTVASTSRSLLPI